MSIMHNEQNLKLKPILAILTESIRYDNQAALKFFNKIKPVHFYENAPYGDLKPEELESAIKYDNLADLEQKLIKLKPDIIQGAEPYASRKALQLCLVAKKVSKKLNIPLIFPMLENRPVKDRFGPITGWVLKKVLRDYAKQAKLIFYLNEGAKKNLLEVGTDQVKLVKLLYGIWGINTAIFKPEDTRHPEKFAKANYGASKIQEANKKILFMGRLDEAKGLPYVVEAWKAIEKDYLDVSIQFAGKGELEHLIDGPRMSIGFIKNSDIPEVLNSVLFTITASVTLKRWEEQIGMTNLQALACGKPVITTKSGAIPEYVTPEVGILVPERDADAIANAMQKLLSDDKLREEMGKKAREYIVKNFDAKKTIEKTEEILLELLK